MNRYTPAVLAFAATLLALPLGSARADDCECTPVVAVLESCATVQPASAQARGGHALLACHASDGGRCEPAAPTPSSTVVQATGTPYYLPPSTPALPESPVEELVFALVTRDGTEGVVRSFDRPPRS
ncbi:MAG: hypothetical protein U0230_19720 [Polyangiales bacterium]